MTAIEFSSPYRHAIAVLRAGVSPSRLLSQTRLESRVNPDPGYWEIWKSLTRTERQRVQAFRKLPVPNWDGTSRTYDRIDLMCSLLSVYVVKYRRWFFQKELERASQR